MTVRHYSWTKLLMVFMVVILGLSAAVGVYSKGEAVKSAGSSTEEFITKHMTNANGTLATYLQPGTSADPDIVAGREALSESLGFWMQYAVKKRDQLNAAMSC